MEKKRREWRAAQLPLVQLVGCDGRRLSFVVTKVARGRRVQAMGNSNKSLHRSGISGLVIDNLSRNAVVTRRVNSTVGRLHNMESNETKLLTEIRDVQREHLAEYRSRQQSLTTARRPAKNRSQNSIGACSDKCVVVLFVLAFLLPFTT